LQPFESFVFLASQCVNLRDLISETPSGIGNQVRECRVGCHPITADVMCHRQFEPAKAGIGLQLRFTQRRFAVAALGSYEHLEPVGAGPRWLQLSGLACNGVRFIQFSSIEKNASKIALRHSR
jgi:hypothetical protein